MARISSGILGGFSGTVGTVVGGNWRGIHYMRAKSARRSYTPTPKQLDQRIKFSLVSRFVYGLSSLLEISFKNYAIQKTGTNSAMSYLLKEAITGASPNFELDFSKVLISRGQLEGAVAPAVAASGVGRIAFTWTNNTGIGNARANDRAIVVVHCPALKQSSYTTIGAARSAAAYTMDVTPFSGQVVHAYLGFLSEDGREVADSVYTGAVTVG